MPTSPGSLAPFMPGKDSQPDEPHSREGARFNRVIRANLQRLGFL